MKKCKQIDIDLEAHLFNHMNFNVNDNVFKILWQNNTLLQPQISNQLEVQLRRQLWEMMYI